MFEWIHHLHESQELEHARHRQAQREAQSNADPLEEIEYITEDGLVVEEMYPQEFLKEFQRLMERRGKKFSSK